MGRAGIFSSVTAAATENRRPVSPLCPVRPPARRTAVQRRVPSVQTPRARAAPSGEYAAPRWARLPRRAVQPQRSPPRLLPAARLLPHPCPRMRKRPGAPTPNPPAPLLPSRGWQATRQGKVSRRGQTHQPFRERAEETPKGKALGEEPSKSWLQGGKGCLQSRP